MNLEIIKNKKIIYILLLLYLLYGSYIMFSNKYINHSYMIISFFMFFKIILNYDKCTLSYMECKIRNVKKEEGYLYSFLNNLISIRYEKIFIFFFIYYIFLNYYYFIIKKRT
jgi:hypothetical protein